MLTARAAGTVGIDAQIGLVDFNLYIVVHFRVNEHRSERSVPARIGVEWRDAHEAVNAGFGFEISVGIVALHVEGYAFHTRFFPRLIIEDLFAIAATVAPPQIHA